MTLRAPDRRVFRSGAPWAFWSCVIVLLALGVGLAVFYAPVDETMGPAQKLVYPHIPAAMTALLASGATFVANLAYLWTRSRVWDATAREATRVTVFCCVIVLLTGMVWGRSYWGTWWTWSPRLTFTLILGTLYAFSMALRATLRPFSRRAMVCAIYGAVTFLDAPLVYLSVRLLPDVHPTSIPLSPPMRRTLVVWLVLFLAAAAGAIAAPLIRDARWRKRHARSAA